MSNTSLGIDVSKLELSTALLQEKKVMKAKFSNDNSGFKKLHQWLSKNKAKDTKICMEATGHYCIAIADFMHQKGYATYVVNPFCIKSFGNAQLSRNKTDEADAVIIAKYIKQNNARPYKPASKTIRKLRELDKCLDAMKATRAQFRTRIADAKHLPKEVIDSWKKLIQSFDEQIKVIEKQLQELINSDGELNQHYQNLQTIPGISETTASTILALVGSLIFKVAF